MVEGTAQNVLYLSVAVGNYKGTKLALPRMPCGPGDDSFPIQGFTRTQFPVRVCFGVTTNKAQGQSFGGSLGLDLRDEVFSHGQLYVALSRTTHPANLTVLLRARDSRTKNVVYLEALQ